MRKKIIVFILCSISVLCLFSCKDSVKKYNANISELRTNMYAAENESMKASAITGRRENPYLLDGQSNEKLDFTVITVTPTSYVASNKYTYSVTLDGKEYKGEFLPHPFAPSLSTDIPLKTVANEIDIIVDCSGTAQTLKLISKISADTISADKALTIALNKLKPQLKEFQVSGKLNAEIYVRLTDNPIDATGGYFWYVAFINETQTTYAVLLNSTTGEVAAIKN